MRLAAIVLSLLFLGLSLGGCLGNSRSQGDDLGPLPSETKVGHNQTLTVNFAVDPVNPLPGQPIRFTDQTEDTEFEVIDRAWDFGDGRGSTLTNPVHVYDASGLYKVVLRAKNSAGVNATASQLITVRISPDGNGTQPPLGEGAYLRFGEPVTLVNTNGGEPSIAIGPEGRIYVSPINDLYRSDDDGQSYTRLGSPSLVSGDSHVVVDPDGVVWLTDLGGLTLPLYGSTTVWTSTNHGEDWLGNPAASDTVLNDRQWIAAPGEGVGYLLYRSCTVLVPPASCFSLGSLMTKSIDGGLTWTPLGRTFTWTSFPFVDPSEGTVYVVQANGNAIDVAVSNSGGTAWSQARAANRQTAPGSIFVNGDVDDAGNAYVAWVDRDSDQLDVWLSSSTDKGTTWSSPKRVSSGVGTNVFPWVAAGGDGNVAVVWYGTSEVVNEADDASPSAQWHVYAAHSSNATEPDAVFAQSRASDVVHVGPICTNGAGCGDNDRDLLDFITLDVHPDGRVVIAYGEDGTTSSTKTQVVVQTGGPLLR